SPVITGAGIPVSFSGECDRSPEMGGVYTLEVRENGVKLADISCLDTGNGDVGGWNYSVPPHSTDGERIYTFTQTNAALLSNSIDAVWIRDTLPPAITQVRINNGAPYISTT